MDSNFIGFTFAFGLADLASTFQVEYSSTIVTLKKVRSNSSQVLIATNSLPPRALLETKAHIYRGSSYLQVRGHVGVAGNEKAHRLVRLSLQFPVLGVVILSLHGCGTLYKVPAPHFMTIPDFSHLNFPGRTDHRIYRHCDVRLTRMRSRAPNLSFYCCRISLLPSPLCPNGSESDSIQHRLVTCSRFDRPQCSPLELSSFN